MTIHNLASYTDQQNQIIKDLLKVWFTNNFDTQPPIHFEIEEDFSRIYSSAIVFLARYGEPGKKRISRIFKISNYYDILQEAISVLKLNHYTSSKFFCRVKNKVYEDYLYSQNKELGLIEYEYAGDMGESASLTTIYLHLLSYYNNIASVRTQLNPETLKAVFDDVTNGLKNHVYSFKSYSDINPRHYFSRKIKHIDSDFIQSIIDDSPDSLKIPLKKNSEGLFTQIQNALNIKIINLYISEEIHGDLNPSNFLVYSGLDRPYGILIDFYEMEEKIKENFTPLFWDFARLEGELTLFLLKETDDKKLNNIFQKLTSCINENQSLTGLDKEQYFFCSVFKKLRQSYFEPIGQSFDLSFTNKDIKINYYYTLFVFYLFVLKFHYSDTEKAIALCFAHYYSQKLLNLDKSGTLKPKKKNRLLISSLIVIILLLCLFFFDYKDQPRLPENYPKQLVKAKEYIDSGFYEEGKKTYIKAISKLPKDLFPYEYSKLNTLLGQSLLKEAREKQSAKIILEALKYFDIAEKNITDHESLHSEILLEKGIAFLNLSELKKSFEDLEKANSDFLKSQKYIKHKTSKLFYEASFYLAIVKIIEYQYNHKKEDLITGQKSLESLLNNTLLNDNLKSKMYHYLALSFYDLSYYEDIELNLSQALLYINNALIDRNPELNLRLFKESHFMLANIYLRMAQYYNNKHYYENAIDSFHKSKTESQNNLERFIDSSIGIARAYIEMNAISENQLNINQAERYIIDIFEAIKKINKSNSLKFKKMEALFLYYKIKNNRNIKRAVTKLIEEINLNKNLSQKEILTLDSIKKEIF